MNQTLKSNSEGSFFLEWTIDINRQKCHWPSSREFLLNLFVPESKRFLDLIWVYGKPNWKKLKSKCFVWLKPTSFVVLPQWESTFGITELVNPSRSFLKKKWEDHKKNQNPNRAVCFKTSIKLSSGLHLNISLFQVSRISKIFISMKTK